MFKKFFSRKPAPTTPATPKVNPKMVAAMSPTQALEDRIGNLHLAQGKSKSQLLNQLSEAVKRGEFTLDQVVARLDSLQAIHLQLLQGHTPSDITSEQWAQLVLVGYTANIRKMAAEQIVDDVSLVSLIRQTKGKDKAVYRILNEKLEALKAETARLAQAKQKQAAILDAMKRLSSASIEPLYEAKSKGLVEQWNQLNDISADAQKEFNEALFVVQQNMVASESPSPDSTVLDTIEAASEALIEPETSAPPSIDRQPFINKLNQRWLSIFSSSTVDPSALKEALQFLSMVQHQWRESDLHGSASQHEQSAFRKLSTAYEIGLPQLQTLLETYGNLDAILATLEQSTDDQSALLQSLDRWMNTVDGVFSEPLPEVIERIKSALTAYRQQVQDVKRQESDQITSLRTQLRRCMAAVKDGHVRRASGLYHGIEEALKTLDLSHHAGIQKQLNETTEALEKLRDWQSYAVLPKKEALIKRMSALVGQSIDPESRAHAIKDMQEEWKQLSKGLQNRQQDLWETFHELAEQAYEPCREFYTEQRHLREVNLQKRQEVVEQLGQYIELAASSAPDVNEIEQVLQAARNDWRRYSPVDRSANKSLQTQFDTHYQSLLAQLQSHQAVFKARKLEIIEQARALLSMEDAKQATEAAKALQKDWVNAGIVPRKEEQRLWKSFREICDELFSRREAQAKTFKEDLKANLKAAETIIASIVELAQQENIASVQSEFNDLKAAYNDLGTLPRASFDKVSTAFKEACETIENRYQTDKAKRADQHWQDLFEWVKKARFGQQSREEIVSAWDELKVPQAAKNLIRIFDVWQAPVDEIHQAALHEKTVDLEILTDYESPKADAQLRMNLQVQKLAEGIGSQPTTKELNKMVVDWLSTGAVEKSEYETLEKRMKAARNHWLQ